MDLKDRVSRIVQAALANPTVPDKQTEPLRNGILLGGPSRVQAFPQKINARLRGETSLARWAITSTSDGWSVGALGDG
jgi:hypothetical protein